MVMENQLYQQELLDHYRHPRNRGELPDAQVSTETFNPSCGDQISMQLIVEDGQLEQIRFQGKGCVISQAAASMLTERSLNQTIEQLEALTKDDMLALVAIPLGPTRLRCALLSLETLHAAVALHRAQKKL